MSLEISNTKISPWLRQVDVSLVVAEQVHSCDVRCSACIYTFFDKTQLQHVETLDLCMSAFVLDRSVQQAYLLAQG
jgi:hypothetical protein